MHACGIELCRNGGRMLLPEEVAYGRVPVEGRAATGVLQQETLHPVHGGDKLQDSEGVSAWAGSVRSHEHDGRDRVETREASLQQQRLACGAAARDPVRVGDASDSDELCHCSRRWSQ